MSWCCAVALLSAVAVVSVSSTADLKFPPGFRFGAATAAYQIEGAWNVSDKTPHIWDTFAHTEGKVLNGDTGDVACDSYHQWRRDIEMVKELGLHFYRFSISWSRLLPNGFSNVVSEDGKRYYSDLIDGLLEAGVEPIVTLYHWDLPQNLQDLGGWANPLIADWFEDYARVAYTLYGDRVKTWLTINEPIIICSLGYGLGLGAPEVRSPMVGFHRCNKNVLLAHAKAWRLYDEEFKPKYHGKVSLANQFIWYEAATPADEELVSLVAQQGYGLYCHPIFSKEGGWPVEFEKVVADNSRREGYGRSRLPPFTQQEKELVRGTFDFLGFNHYTSRMVRAARPGETASRWPFLGAPELGAVMEDNPDWPVASSFWFRENPPGIRKVLNWLKQQYGDVEVLITENGYSSRGMGLEDDHRIHYYQTYLEQVLLAIKEDEVNVTGYTAWSLMDNFEWNEGYFSKFGLYEVDFADPERKRTPRKSAKYYAKIIQEHSLPTAREEL